MADRNRPSTSKRLATEDQLFVSNINNSFFLELLAMMLWPTFFQYLAVGLMSNRVSAHGWTVRKRSDHLFCEHDYNTGSTDDIIHEPLSVACTICIRPQYYLESILRSLVSVSQGGSRVANLDIVSFV